jgi:hypothetical protein
VTVGREDRPFGAGDVELTRPTTVGPRQEDRIDAGDASGLYLAWPPASRIGALPSGPTVRSVIRFGFLVSLTTARRGPAGAAAIATPPASSSASAPAPSARPIK